QARAGPGSRTHRPGPATRRARRHRISVLFRARLSPCSRGTPFGRPGNVPAGLTWEETMNASDESERDRSTRNFGELLQARRVAQGGVPILFGFLLTVAFTGRYESADSVVHGLHLVAVALAVVATALLTATAAWHRMLFRQRQRAEIVRAANRMAL